MVAFSFSEENFVIPILSGRKNQTTRPLTTGRLKQLKNNTGLQLYYQQRSKNGFKISDALKTDLLIIKLKHEGPYIVDGNCTLPFPDEKAADLARRDGFKDYQEMFNWFVRKYGQEKTTDDLWIVVRWRLAK